MENWPKTALINLIIQKIIKRIARILKKAIQN